MGKSRFEELTPGGKKIWKHIRMAEPSNRRDKAIDNIVKPAKEYKSADQAKAEKGK